VFFFLFEPPLVRAFFTDPFSFFQKFFDSSTLMPVLVGSKKSFAFFQALLHLLAESIRLRPPRPSRIAAPRSTKKLQASLLYFSSFSVSSLFRRFRSLAPSFRRRDWPYLDLSFPPPGFSSPLFSRSFPTSNNRPLSGPELHSPFGLVSPFEADSYSNRPKPLFSISSSLQACP